MNANWDEELLSMVDLGISYTASPPTEMMYEQDDLVEFYDVCDVQVKDLPMTKRFTDDQRVVVVVASSSTQHIPPQMHNILLTTTSDTSSDPQLQPDPESKSDCTTSLYWASIYMGAEASMMHLRYLLHNFQIAAFKKCMSDTGNKNTVTQTLDI
jgi:hypothetical protein